MNIHEIDEGVYVRVEREKGEKETEMYSLLYNPIFKKSTASATDLWHPMLGCLDAGWQIYNEFAAILRALTASGVCSKTLVPCRLDRISQGAQMSYIAPLYRRERRFGEIC